MKEEEQKQKEEDLRIAKEKERQKQDYIERQQIAAKNRQASEGVQKKPQTAQPNPLLRGLQGNQIVDQREKEQKERDEAKKQFLEMQAAAARNRKQILDQARGSSPSQRPVNPQISERKESERKESDQAKKDEEYYEIARQNAIQNRLIAEKNKKILDEQMGRPVARSSPAVEINERQENSGKEKRLAEEKEKLQQLENARKQFVEERRALQAKQNQQSQVVQEKEDITHVSEDKQKDSAQKLREKLEKKHDEEQDQLNKLEEARKQAFEERKALEARRKQQDLDVYEDKFETEDEPSQVVESPPIKSRPNTEGRSLPKGKACKNTDDTDIKTRKKKKRLRLRTKASRNPL